MAPTRVMPARWQALLGLLLAGLLLAGPAAADGDVLPPQAAADAAPVLRLAARLEEGRPAYSGRRLADSVVVAAVEEERNPFDSGYPWRGAAPDKLDWDGVKRDTAYFMGYQIAVLGVLYLMPEDVTNWDKESITTGDLMDKWWDNVTHPEWDEDDWWINYVLHPYWGGTYYIRGRERGMDRQQAFLFSAFLSTLYEYSFEAFAEPVSIQDLIFTPVLGSLVGEYLFSPLREHIRAKQGELTWTDKTLLFATDPLGVLGSWTDQALGIKSQLSFQPIGQTGPRLGNLDREDGLPRSASLAAQARRPWGLQFEMAW